MANTKQQMHFVLVHGACHGAWTWHKLKPRLESAGHRVTAIDLAASSIDSRAIHEVTSLAAYTEPLLKFMEEKVPPRQKVILVGHSLGGMNLALAMDRFPEKISVAVFLTAFIPDTHHRPSHVLEQLKETAPTGHWLDTNFSPSSQSKEPLTTMFFGPKFIRSRLYQLCSEEDFSLATMLVRPGSLFIEDLSTEENFSDERYGSVDKVFIFCGEDKAIWVEFQRWMIAHSGVKKVMEMKDADHMAMLSRPQELYNCLMEIAGNHT